MMMMMNMKMMDEKKRKEKTCLSKQAWKNLPVK